MDIKRYLQRIDYKARIAPDLNTLSALQYAHVMAVPFENLDIHLGIPIVLDLDLIYKKVVEENRGGFCYELNGLFYQLLQALGFSCKRISARVYDEKKGYGFEYDHLAILVEIDEQEYLTDVGFGRFSFRPLLLKLYAEQEDFDGIFMLDSYLENYIRVNRIINQQAKPEYIFTRQERSYEEYSAMCQYHQSNPDSHFTRKRLISMPNVKGRVSITGNILKIQEGSEKREVVLENEEAFHLALLENFNVSLK